MSTKGDVTLTSADGKSVTLSGVEYVWKLVQDSRVRHRGWSRDFADSIHYALTGATIRLHRWHHRRMPWRLAKKVLANPQRYPDHKVRAARERKKRRGRAWARGVIRSWSSLGTGVVSTSAWPRGGASVVVVDDPG